MKKSIIAIIIALNMLLSTGYKAYASGEVAAALAVAGGSIGTAGLVAGSIPALPIAAGLAAGALIAVGINIALSDASQQQGMTKSQFMQAKLEEWGTAAGKTKDQIADAILSGATVARDGTIYLGKEAGKLLNQFGNWLFGTDQVINTIPVIPSTVTVGGLNCPFGNNFRNTGSYSDYSYVFSENVALVMGYVGSDRIVTAFCDKPFTCNMYRRNSSGVEHLEGKYNAKSKYGSYYANTNIDMGSYYNSLEGVTVPEVPTAISNRYITAWLRSLDGSLLPGGSIDADTDGFTGDEDTWRDNAGVLLPNEGMNIALNPDLLGTIADQIGDIVKDGTIAIKDYVDAVIDSVNDLPIDIPVTDDKTGVIEIPQIPAIPFEDTASIEDVPDTDIPTDKDPIIDPTIPVVPDGDGVDALGNLTLDLKSVFPFCLPFDAVDMIKLLNVPAQAPFYHVHVPIPLVNESIDFDLDLSPFDSVAAVARKMEIMLFCVGLALTTRQIIRS